MREERERGWQAPLRPRLWERIVYVDRPWRWFGIKGAISRYRDNQNSTKSTKIHDVDVLYIINGHTTWNWVILRLTRRSWLIAWRSVSLGKVSPKKKAHVELSRKTWSGVHRLTRERCESDKIAAERIKRSPCDEDFAHRKSTSRGELWCMWSLTSLLECDWRNSYLSCSWYGHWTFPRSFIHPNTGPSFV